MIKRGHVYMVIYPDSKMFYTRRNYIIFSPSNDMTSNDIKKEKGIKCIFNINLGREVWTSIRIGVMDAIKIRKLKTEENIQEMVDVIKKLGMTYSKKLNKINKYEKYDNKKPKKHNMIHII